MQYSDWRRLLFRKTNAGCHLQEKFSTSKRYFWLQNLNKPSGDRRKIFCLKCIYYLDNIFSTPPLDSPIGLSWEIYAEKLRPYTSFQQDVLRANYESRRPSAFLKNLSRQREGTLKPRLWFKKMVNLTHLKNFISIHKIKFPTKSEHQSFVENFRFRNSKSVGENK